MTAVAAVALFIVGAAVVIQNGAKDSTEDITATEQSAEAPAMAESQIMAADGAEASGETTTALTDRSKEGGTISQESLSNSESAATEPAALTPTNEDHALQGDDATEGSLDDKTTIELIEPLPLELSACRDAPTLELAEGERLEYLGPSPEDDEGERVLLVLADGSEFFADINLRTCALKFIEAAPLSRTSP